MLDDMATFGGDALRLVHAVVLNDRFDEDGKPMTPTKVRLDAATDLLDQFPGQGQDQHRPERVERWVFVSFSHLSPASGRHWPGTPRHL